jgi:hypothetical protein
MVYLIPLIVDYVRLLKEVEADRNSIVQKHTEEEHSTLVAQRPGEQGGNANGPAIITNFTNANYTE